MTLGIQADDLTGACDCAAPFAARGLETLVLLPGVPGPQLLPAVLVVDTESRRAPPGPARDAVAGAAARLRAAGVRIRYKKVDSTLRGQLAAEIAGLLDEQDPRQVVICPALPAQGRTVRDGVVHVEGQPVDLSAFAGDPAFPPTGASVLALVAASGLGPVASIPLETVRRGPSAVRARLSLPVPAVVADAETDADLDGIAAACDEDGPLVAGSAGLAAALARRLPGAEGTARPGVRARRPLLVVAGSRHPVTHLQVDRLASRGVGGVWIGGVEPDLPAPRSPGGDWFVAARGVDPDEPPVSPGAMAERLAEAARWALAAGPDRFRTLLLTGGDTALAVCRALGASGIRLAGEVEPGVPIGSLVGGRCDGLVVVTKAGGFGDPAALCRVLETAA